MRTERLDCGPLCFCFVRRMEMYGEVWYNLGNSAEVKKMSIMDAFDRDGEEIIRAVNNVRRIEDFPKTVLVVFSAKMCKLFLNKYDAVKIGRASCRERV